MELEQRVKTLEYEMKILKNEIQRTLLDVQEQILVHYYPALRSVEAIPSEGIIQAMEAVRAKQASQSAAPPWPKIKKVSLDEIRVAQNEFADEPAPVDHTTVTKLVEWAKDQDAGSGSRSGGSAPPAALDRGNLKLLEWLTKSAAKVGDDRDGQNVNAVLDELAKLNVLVSRASSIEEALRMIQEAKLG